MSYSTMPHSTSRAFKIPFFLLALFPLIALCLSQARCAPSPALDKPGPQALETSSSVSLWDQLVRFCPRSTESTAEKTSPQDWRIDPTPQHKIKLPTYRVLKRPPLPLISNPSSVCKDRYRTLPPEALKKALGRGGYFDILAYGTGGKIEKVFYLDPALRSRPLKDRLFIWIPEGLLKTEKKALLAHISQLRQQIYGLPGNVPTEIAPKTDAQKGGKGPS